MRFELVQFLDLSSVPAYLLHSIQIEPAGNRDFEKVAASVITARRMAAPSSALATAVGRSAVAGSPAPMSTLLWGFPRSGRSG